MPKTIIKLIKNNIKKNTTKTIYLFLLTVLTSLMFLFIPIYIESEEAHELASKKENFGSYQYILIDATQTQLQESQTHPFIPQTNLMSIYGSMNQSAVGYIDKTDLLPIHLLSGRLPATDQEVALDQQALLEWNPNAKIGETYSFPLTLTDGTTIHESLTLVGIVKEYRLNIPLESIGVFLTQRDWPAQHNLYYFSSTSKPYFSTDHLYVNELVYPELAQNPVIVMNTKQTVIFFCIVIALVIMSTGIGSLTNQESKQMQYLRGIGATQGQVAKMIIWEISLICLPAILLANILVLSLIVPIETILGFPLVNIHTHLITGLILSILAILGGCLIPILKHMHSPLLGQLSQQKKQIRWFNKKSRITVFKLSFRHIHFHFGQFFIYVFLTSIFISQLADTTIRLIRLYNNIDIDHTDYVIYTDNPDLLKNTDIEGLKLIRQDSYQNLELSFYEKNLYFVSHSPFLQICNVEPLDLSSISIDENAFLNGDEVILYLPTRYQYLSDVPIIENENYPIGGLVIDKNFKVGDLLQLGNAHIRVGAIINELDTPEYDSSRQPYALFVSSSFITRYQDELDLSHIQTTLYGYLDDPLFYPSVTHEIYQNIGNDTMTSVMDYARESMYQDYNLLQKTLKYSVTLIAYSLLIILVTYQLIISDIDQRKNQMNQFRSIGMTKHQMWKMIWIETIFICLILFFSNFIYTYNSNLYCAWKIKDLNWLNQSSSTPLYVFIPIMIIILLFIIVTRTIKSYKIIHKPISIRYHD